MANNFQLNVKAIIDSVDLQEQIKKIKIDPIKIQVDLGGIGNSNSGTSQAAGIAASFDQAGVAVDKFRGKIVDTFTIAEDGTRKQVSQMQSVQNGYDSQIQTLLEVDKKTGLLSATQQKIATDTSAGTSEIVRQGKAWADLAAEIKSNYLKDLEYEGKTLQKNTEENKKYQAELSRQGKAWADLAAEIKSNYLKDLEYEGKTLQKNTEENKKYQAELSRQGKAWADLNTQQEKAQDSADDLHSKYQKMIDQDYAKYLNKQAAEEQKLSNQEAILKKQFDDRVASNAAGIQTLKVRMTGLTDEQLRLVNAGERLNEIQSMTNVDQQAKAIRSLTADMNAASRGTNTFAATLQYMTERFIQIGIYVAIFRKLTNAIGDMIETVSSLDKSLVELRKVTDMTDSQLESFTKTAFEVGNAVARTGQEVIDAAAIFKRSGYEINESLDLSKAAMTMLNVGDGIDNVSDAATTLISVLKGYNLEADKAMDVTSLINEVSNNASINFEDLAEGLTRTSAVFNQAGVSMGKLSGLLTGTQEILQNIEKSSSGLLVISQRLRGVTEISEDGYEGVSKLSKAFKSIANIDIFDQQTGQLRDTYSILEDMARVFPTLTKNQRQYLGEMASGKRQINVLESLLANWQGVEKAVKAATNSTGSAEKENSKYLNSIEGKTKAVESAMQKLASATVDDNLVKWFLDVEKNLIDLQTNLGGLTPLILTIITLMSSKLVPALGSVIKTIKESFSVFSKTKQVSEDVAKNIAINTQLLNTAKISATGFFTAISAGITVISLIVGVVSSLIQKHREYNESLIASAKASSENFNKISELYTQYKDLSDIQERTAEQESELVTIGNSLEESLSSRSTTLSKLKEGTKEYNAELLKQIKNEAALSLAKFRIGLNASKENFSSGEYAVAESFLNQGIGSLLTNTGYKQAIKTVKEELKDFWSVWSGKYESGSLENTPKFLNSTRIALKSLTTEVEKAREAGNEELALQIESTDLYKQLAAVESELTPVVQSYAEQLVSVQIAQAAFNGTLPTSQEELDEFKKNLFATVDPTNQFNDVLGKVVDTFFSFGKVVDDSNKYISKTKTWKESIASLTSEIGNMDNAQSALSKAVEEFNTNGSLSFDTIKSLLSLGGDYLQYLSIENGQLVLNKSGIIALTEAKKAELLQDLEMARSSEILDARENEREQLEILRNEHLSGWEQREREIEIAQEANDEIIRITDAYGNEIAMVSLLGTTSSETTTELEKATEAYEKQSDVLDDAQSAYETLDSAIKEYNKNGVLSVDTLQSLLSLSPEYLQMFFNQAGALGEAKAATMAHAEALKEAKIQELQAAATADILNLANGKISSLSPIAASAIAGLGDKAQAAGNKSATAIPKVAGLAAALQAVIDASKGKLTGINLSDFTSGANAIADAYKSIANGISDIGTSFGGGSSGSGSSKASQQAKAIADANEKLLNTTMKMIKAQKEDQIEVLEDELDLEEKLYKAEKKRLEDQIDKYKDVIDAKRKSLKLDKEQSEYDDEIADKNKEISDIQNRLTELEFDTSASAMAEKLKLQEDLTRKQKDLSKSQADREYDLTNQALDDDYEAYKKSQEEQINILDQNFEATKTDYKDRIQLLKDYLEEEGTIRTDALNMMNSKSAEFYNNLFAWNARFGDVTNATLQSIIDKAYEVVSISSGSGKSSKKKPTTPAPKTPPLLTKPSQKPPGAELYHDGLDAGFVGEGLKGNEEFIKALKGEILVNPKQQEDYMRKILPNVLKNAYAGGATSVYAGMNMQYDKLIEINVSGSIDSNSMSKIESTVNQAFTRLTGALSQRGTVRKANAFAT